MERLKSIFRKLLSEKPKQGVEQITENQQIEDTVQSNHEEELVEISGQLGVDCFWVYPAGSVEVDGQPINQPFIGYSFDDFDMAPYEVKGVRTIDGLSLQIAMNTVKGKISQCRYNRKPVLMTLEQLEQLVPPINGMAPQA